MKTILLYILIFTTNVLFSQLANDASNALITCGDSNYDFTFQGAGNLDITNNTCSSGENNSVWLLINIETSGTLGFELIPDASDIGIDFDFFIFGPNVTSGNLGNAIRCSTTNPQAANQGNNSTGMNNSETDTAEGPGADGNSFVQSLNVLAGETYYIMIDKPPITDGFEDGFTIVWSGTATFPTSPSNQLPAGIDLNLQSCDDDNDGITTYNLQQNENDLVNGQDVTVAYFNNLNDAQLNLTAIPNIDLGNYSIPNTDNPDEIVFVRLTDNTTGCFSIFNIELEPFLFTLIDPENLYECDNSITFFNFNFDIQSNTLISTNTDTIISYYLSQLDAETGLPATQIGNNYTNISNPEEIWYRLENTIIGCIYVNKFEIEVIQTFFESTEPTFNFIDENLIYCQDQFPITDRIEIIFVNNNINNYAFLWSTGETTSSIDISAEGDYIVTITNPQGCIETKKHIVTASKVFNNDEPNFIDETLFYCINDFPETTTLTTGIDNNLITDYNIEWFNSAGDSLLDYPNSSISPDLLVNQSDDYTVIVTNSLNCEVSRTITINPTSIANFTKILITENEFFRKVSVIVEVSGFGDYQYAIVAPNFSAITDDDIYQNENIFENINYGKHKLLVRDINSNGCDEILEETIFILDYPKFITPNNDGIYDTWNIDNSGAYNNEIISEFNTTSNVTIFDRIGRLVATIDPKGLGWDGTFKGKPLPSSDYWFVVKFVDFTGKIYTKKGHFSLKN